MNVNDCIYSILALASAHPRGQECPRSNSKAYLSPRARALAPHMGGWGVVLLALLLMLCGCSSDDEDTSVEQSNVQVTFNIMLDNLSGTTRAGTWGDDDYDKETATQWENTVAAGKLQVLLYDSNGTFVAQVTNLRTINLDATTNSAYQVRGAVAVADSLLTDGKFDCKIVVLCNYDKAATPVSGTSKLADLAYELYQYNASGIVAKTSYIPMFGVKEYTGTDALALQKGAIVDAGDISLLRAMAKIRVHLSDAAAQEFTLLSTTISDYNQRGYILPTGFADVVETTDLYYEGTTSPLSFHPRTALAGKPLSFMTETTGTSLITYLPEHITTTNATTGDTTPYLSVTIAPKGNTAEAGTYSINLRQYTDGVEAKTNLNLIRNTVYDYEITTVGPTLTLRYQAIDWATGGGDITFY